MYNLKFCPIPFKTSHNCVRQIIGYIGYNNYCSYPNSQSAGAGHTSSTPTAAAFPSMGGQASMSTASASSPFPQSSAAGANQSQISASANMGAAMQHPSPATPMPRYRVAYPTPSRGALSAMLSSSAVTPGKYR